MMLQSRNGPNAKLPFWYNDPQLPHPGLCYGDDLNNMGGAYSDLLIILILMCLFEVLRLRIDLRSLKLNIEREIKQLVQFHRTVGSTSKVRVVIHVDLTDRMIE